MPASIPSYASFVLQWVCCGKSGCRRCGGTDYAHGPYWYATWWDARNERHRTAYVGKELSEEQREQMAYQEKHATLRTQPPIMWPRRREVTPRAPGGKRPR